MAYGRSPNFTSKPIDSFIEYDLFMTNNWKEQLHFSLVVPIKSPLLPTFSTPKKFK